MLKRIVHHFVGNNNNGTEISAGVVKEAKMKKHQAKETPHLEIKELNLENEKLKQEVEELKIDNEFLENEVRYQGNHSV